MHGIAAFKAAAAAGLNAIEEAAQRLKAEAADYKTRADQIEDRLSDERIDLIHEASKRLAEADAYYNAILIFAEAYAAVAGGKPDTRAAEDKQRAKWRRLLKAWRAKAEISQMKAAEILGVTFATINRIENGRYKPGYKVRRLILDKCREIGIEPEEEEI